MVTPIEATQKTFRSRFEGERKDGGLYVASKRSDRSLCSELESSVATARPRFTLGFKVCAVTSRLSVFLLRFLPDSYRFKVRDRIVGDITRIQVDVLDSVVLGSLHGRRRTFRVSLFDGRFLPRVLTRRSFLRGSRPVEWGCEVESFPADFSGSVGADCPSPCRGEHLFKLLERRGYVRCGSVEVSATASVKRSLHVIRVVLKLPLERRQIPFLVSKAALKCCSIWGEMSGSKGDEALAEYKKALEVMSARIAAPKRVAPTEDDDEVQIIRSRKSQAVSAVAPSSSKKKSKASGSSPKGSPSAPYDWATVITNLNAKVFPSTPVLLASEEDSSWLFSRSRVASQLYHLGERMEGAASTKVEMDTLASQLREEKDASLAKDKDIKALRLKVRNQEKAGDLAETENVSLRSQLKNREEELTDLKDATETFEAEKAMAVNGAKVVARWELMREWLSGQTNSWDPVNTLEQYKTVKITEAELLGLPYPSFEYEPQVAGDEEVKKTPEPAADDPPAN
ncbi:hypothetical protein F2Q70_00017770 [Brassica cretica]|uniref:Uncharacterized protein n=1 Tax=Brassica cretica TaxID=69181 RepID=A0A8S9HTY3_BRACR|nr:hypothetical protein F2Q70_00017770 [Brassica cretica]